MYQLGLQYISITNLTKTCHFMVQFLQNHMKNHREKTLHHLFSHLMASENKILWHTFLYGPKKLQEGFALFFFSFLSPRKETSAHCSVQVTNVKGHKNIVSETKCKIFHWVFQQPVSIFQVLHFCVGSDNFETFFPA